MNAWHESTNSWNELAGQYLISSHLFSNSLPNAQILLPTYTVPVTGSLAADSSLYITPLLWLSCGYNSQWHHVIFPSCNGEAHFPHGTATSASSVDAPGHQSAHLAMRWHEDEHAASAKRSGPLTGRSNERNSQNALDTAHRIAYHRMSSQVTSVSVSVSRLVSSWLSIAISESVTPYSSSG
jgi:hypothetical protein